MDKFYFTNNFKVLFICRRGAPFLGVHIQIYVGSWINLRFNHQRWSGGYHRISSIKWPRLANVSWKMLTWGILFNPVDKTAPVHCNGRQDLPL